MASPSAGTNRLEATIVAKPTVPETTQHMHAAPEPAADAAAKPDETHAPHADDEAHSSHAVSVTHAEEPAESMLPPAAKPAPKAAAAIYSTSGRATSSTAGKAAGSKGKSGSGRGVALAALPLLALGAAGVWLLRKWRASHGTPARPTSSAAIKGKRALSSPTRPKPKSAKRDSTKSASAAAKDAAADATAESGGQPAVAEEPAVAIAPDTFEILTKELSLLPPPAPPPPMAPPPLAGMIFTVSENMDIASVETTYGVPAWAEHCATASDSCPAVKRALGAGAACVGKTGMQPAGLDLIGANYGNPSNKLRTSGGAHTGAALSVALGHVNFALAPDTLGEARVPAACLGICGYRPSPGVLGGPGAGSGGSAHDAVCVLSREAAPLLKVAEVLGAPGSANLRGEIIKFVVAQDLFDMCAPEFQPAILALKKAILKWAGSDQAGAVQLVRFLSSNLEGWEELVPPQDDSEIRVNGCLEAAVCAATTLQHAELHRRAGPIEAAVHAAAAADMAAHAIDVPADAATAVTVDAQVAAAPASSTDVGVGAVEVCGEAGEKGEMAAEPAASAADVAQVADRGGSTGSAAGAADGPVDAEAAAAAGATDESSGSKAVADENLTPSKGEESNTEHAASAEPTAAAKAPDSLLPPAPPASKVAAAQKLASELLECLRSTVKPDTIMVLPTLPFPAPRRDAPEVELGVFAKMTRCFNALATLGGCPTVVVPVGTLRDGSPVCMTLMAVTRFDMRLLAVAQKLGPMIRESFEAVKEEISAMALRQAQEEEQARARAAAEAAAAAQGEKAGRKGGAQAAKPPAGAAAAAAAAPQVDPKKAEKAEKAKAKGNEAFQAGKYADAFNEYTRAIGLNPHTPVYYSNRAIACIKLFRFEQAEEDCNKALNFELSDKDKVKALLRRATARDALQKYGGAEKDLRSVLALEPNNKQAREDLQALRRHQSEMAEAQKAMAQQLRAQQMAAAAAAAAGASLPPGAAGFPTGMAGAGLPPGFDPAMFEEMYGAGAYGGPGDGLAM